MKKAELEDLVCQFTIFIRATYANAGLPLPNEDAEWNSEEEACLIYNAIRAIGRKEAVAALLLAEKNATERERLNNLVNEVPVLS